MLTVAALCCAIWVFLLFGHGRFWRAGPVLPPDIPLQAPDVAIVVPARDEAALIEPTLRSLLAQNYPGTFRVILVDDGSSDGTGEIARRLAEPRLLVLSGASRPTGWSGKLWAVHQGVSQAGRAPFVLLTDADVVHEPGHLSALVAQAERGDYDLVSEMVVLGCDSAAERALVPAFVLFFQLLYPFDQVNDPLSPTAAAAGGTMLLRNRALVRLGGFPALRDCLIDDVALAAAVKRTGRIWIGHSALAHSMRPYRTPGDIWRMVARTAYVQLRRSPALLAGTLLGMALVWLVPPAIALFGHGLARLFGLLAWVMLAASYLPTLARFSRSPLWAPLLPLIALFYMAATVGSAVDHYTGRGVTWKGRAYGGAPE